MVDGRAALATLLRHEAKSSSLKFALVRALNDLALTYPLAPGTDVVVPLNAVAQRWLVYYWAFVGDTPVLQAPQAQRASGLGQDLSFRAPLASLRAAWDAFIGTASGPADGALLLADYQVGRGRLPDDLQGLTGQTLKVISRAVQQPVRYAGPGAAHSLFSAPAPALTLSGQLLPGTAPTARAFVVPAALWQALVDLSLWVEALCLHEWSLYTERVAQTPRVMRGEAFTLLTSMPAGRVPLTWERLQVRLLMLGGITFHCPWTARPLDLNTFDLDHLIPLSAQPFHELWNLVPSDPVHNQHVKRARIPDAGRLQAAQGVLAQTYAAYGTQGPTDAVLRRDVASRFGALPESTALAQRVLALADHIADARNVPRY